MNYIIDEIVVDGMVTETNIGEIVAVLKAKSEAQSGVTTGPQSSTA